jgi:3a0107s02c: phosphate ABC transporter, permease protein PstA
MVGSALFAFPVEWWVESIWMNMLRKGSWYVLYEWWRTIWAVFLLSFSVCSVWRCLSIIWALVTVFWRVLWR